MSGGVWDIARLRTATEAAGVGLWSWNVDTDRIELDELSHVIWGISDQGVTTFEKLSAQIHPADLDKVRATFAAQREIPGRYESDFRIQHGKDIRWVSARGRGDDQGMINRILYGVFLDVTARKAAEEVREMVTGEMNHRVKNILAMTQALAFFSARSTNTKQEMADDLAQRLDAFSKAHDLIRPAFDSQSPAIGIRALLSVLLSPYVIDERVQIFASDILVGEKSATCLALIVHELATNAVKYGSLSQLSGKLRVSCEEHEGDVKIIWRETGGPLVEPPAGKPGFGTRMVARSVENQMGGSLEMAWPPEGLALTIHVSKALLGE